MIFTKGQFNAVAEDGTTSALDVLIGGGSGSSVTVTPNLTSGTLVGTITVDDTTYSLYAPTGGSGSGSGSTVSVSRNLTSGTEVGTITVDGASYVLYAPTPTTYSSKDAVSGGTETSLVTTGEKYTWNNKSNLTIGTTSTTAAAGNHTHSQYLTSSSTLDATKLSGAIPASSYTAGDTVSFSQNLTSGVEVGTITINGTDYVMYAPSSSGGSSGGSSVSVTRSVTSGTKIATLTVDGATYDLYAPSATTYSSKAAASGGTDVSLVTTGEKYTWNNKADSDTTYSFTVDSNGVLTIVEA